jgi:uncharacterized RDD family membrane protein YckC
VRPAKITDRFLAYLIDILPFVVGFYATLWFMIVKSAQWPNTVQIWQRNLLGWLVLYLLYQTIANSAGATIGKSLFGLRVVRLDGQPLGPLRGALRAFGYLLSTPLMNLGFLWAIFQPQSRSWHDLIAGCIVIEGEEKSQAAALGSAALSFAVLMAMVIGSVWSVVAAPTPADIEAVARANEGLQVLAAVEESYRQRTGTYTNSLVELARESGDPRGFKEAMGQIFMPTGFVFRASKAQYDLSGLARDRRQSRVRLVGPPSQ